MPALHVRGRFNPRHEGPIIICEMIIIIIIQLLLPEVLLSLVCRLYMINQRARAMMDPSVASTTKSHRAGLSTISESGWVAGLMVISLTAKVKGDSKENRLQINYLNRKTFLHSQQL